MSDKNLTFKEQIAKAENVENLTILESGNSMVAVASELQGRVLTTSANGPDGVGYGWVKWETITNNQHREKKAYLGGESRLWFGPEFGEFSIFFDSGKEQIDDNMRAPSDLETSMFDIIEETNSHITSQGNLSITNSHGFTFKLNALRKISILPKDELMTLLESAVPNDINYVGFRSETSIKNIDDKEWTKENGLLSIWELGCMLTSKDTKVIIPLKKQSEEISSYFSPIDSTRMIVKDSVLYFKSDASYFSKIGVPPNLSKNIFGSYSPSQNLLSITRYSLSEADSIYVNSIKGNTDPYKGDIINIFNGARSANPERNWPFYEFESSSSALQLEPADVKNHWQEIYHFEGNIQSLNKIAHTLLGINLDDIPTF